MRKLMPLAPCTSQHFAAVLPAGLARPWHIMQAAASSLVRQLALASIIVHALRSFRDKPFTKLRLNPTLNLL